MKPRPYRGAIIILFVAVLAGGWLRFHDLDQPIGGYHSMNEAWHIIIARNFDSASFFQPRATGNNVDRKIRALYVYTVYAGFRIFGEKPALARGVSAVSGVMAVVFIFFIAAKLGGPHAAAAAALLLAVSPIHTILSRNAQPDAMASSLTLLAALLFLCSFSNRKHLWLVLSGLVWGAAVFTKNSALLLAPALLVHDIANSENGKTTFKRFAWFAAPAVLVPAPFLLYQLFTNAAGMVSLYRQIVLNIPGFQELGYIVNEAAWALSPGVFVAGLGGLIFIALKKFRTAALVWAGACVFLFQYFLQHVHSYYFLSAAPFLVLAAALLIGNFRARVRVPLFALLAVSSLCFTLLCYAGIKHDFSRLRDAAHIIKSESSSGVVIMPRYIMNNYGPVAAYYLPGFTTLTQEELEADKSTGIVHVPEKGKIYFLRSAGPGHLERTLHPLYETPIAHHFSGVCIGGRIFYMLPRNPHSFIPESFGTTRARRSCQLFQEFAQNISLVINRVPEGADIIMKRDAAGNPEIQFSPHSSGGSRPTP